MRKKEIEGTDRMEEERDRDWRQYEKEGKKERKGIGKKN